MANEQYIILTGATSGIGEAMTKQLAVRGYNVIAIGRNEQKLQSMTKVDERIYPLRANITTYKGLELIRAAVPQDAELTAIVHAAAVIGPFDSVNWNEPIELSEEQFLHQKTNVSAPMVLTMMLAHRMNADGRVLFLASYFADKTAEKVKALQQICGSYCHSKLKLETEAQALRQALSEHASEYISPKILLAKPGAVKDTKIYNFFWKKAEEKGLQPGEAITPKESAAFLVELLVGEKRPNNAVCEAQVWDIRKDAGSFMSSSSETMALTCSG